MKNLFAILLCICACALFGTFAFGQSSTSIVLDALSLTPVNADAVTGLSLDPIGLDKSNRQCARIKLHINRMTPEEISQIEVRPIGGSVIVMKSAPAYDGIGLIVELTAKPETRFYLHHNKYGDSNPVTVSLEGNKEYTMNAWNETKLSIVVTFPESGAEVYLDEAFRGFVENNHLTISDLTLGHHNLSFRYSAGDYSENIYISSASIFFEIDPEKKETFTREQTTTTGTLVKDYYEDFSITSAKDLSYKGSANSYIISESGDYWFPVVKGNSSEQVGKVATAELLWESFGTYTAPSVNDLIKSTLYEDGKIYFRTADTFKEGNAVIAAKDADGTILWSWHIWLTDEPQCKEYSNNAGTMMDRNLGATSPTYGDTSALGLLYQWGRKDPFLGSSSISSNIVANSTITWPSAVESNSIIGTIEYSTEHPTTFITYNSNNYDWYYTDSQSTDNTRWQPNKTIYDPCPVGWRVPDGGDNGVWNIAGFSDTTYDNANEGMLFNTTSSSNSWYPATGYRDARDATLEGVGYYGYYWSVTHLNYRAYTLNFSYFGNIYPMNRSYRARGFSIRCFRETEESSNHSAE